MANHDLPPSSRNTEFVVRIIQMSGVVFILAGVVVFFNLGGLSASLGLIENGLSQILGGVLCLVGISDLIVVPRIFEKRLSSRRSEE